MSIYIENPKRQFCQKGIQIIFFKCRLSNDNQSNKENCQNGDSCDEKDDSKIKISLFAEYIYFQKIDSSINVSISLFYKYSHIREIC